MIVLAVAEFFRTDIATAIAAFGALVTAIAAFCALIYASKQLDSAHDATRIDLTFRLYEHQLNAEFVRHIAKTADFLAIAQNGAERERVARQRWRRWNEMSRSERGQIVLYLNHLEAVGGLFQSERLEEEAAMDLFGVAAATFWERADWFVERVRASKPGAEKAFDKWEALVDAFRDREQGEE
jgi:hypothetical protein